MNALLYSGICVLLLWAGYRYYAGAFEKFLGVDAHRKTPAVAKNDGVDYVPARHWLVLFGHHFSSIAGAGPVIGPVIALGLWGWGPATLFIIIGTILIGGIHDMGTLFMSVRQDGKSVADISEEAISRRARLIFSYFVLIALIVVVAVFVYFCAETFVVEPKVVLPSLGLVPVAVLTGWMMYRRKNGLALATILGLGSLLCLIFLGEIFPVILPRGFEMQLWIAVLLGYCFIASVLPVNVLLQPRDYLSSYLLFFGVAAGFAGMITSRPNFTLPVFTGWGSAEGPLWPMLFVTIACGAISGFHSLVSAGTTSKQISGERDLKRIGFGAMVAEAVVSVIAISAIAGSFATMGAFKASLSNGGPVGAFGHGFGNMTRYIFGPYGKFIAIILLNSFILTTLDTTTRIARYILQELFSTLDRFLATILIVLAGGWIAVSGNWRAMWPVFGAANQLIAALTLFVLSSWLLARGKHMRYTFIPASFMLVTTVGALIYQFGLFIKGGKWFLACLDALLLALSANMLIEIALWVRSKIGNNRGKKCPGI